MLIFDTLPDFRLRACLALCLVVSLTLAADVYGQASTIVVGEGQRPSLAPDGSFVVFDCDDTPFVDNIICLYEVATGSLTQHTLPIDNIEWQTISMTDNAELIAISANDPALETGPQVHIFERQTGTLRVVSVNRNGELGDGSHEAPAMARDGRFVIFESTSNNWNFPRPEPKDHWDLYRYDRRTGVLNRTSDPWDGSPVQLDGREHLRDDTTYGTSDVSDDGLRMVYASVAPNLVPGDNNQSLDGFVRYHDDTVVRFTLDSAGNECETVLLDQSAISGDGRVVAFVGGGWNRDSSGERVGCLDPDPQTRQAFVHDLETGQTFMVSGTPAGEQPIWERPDGSTGIATAQEDVILISQEGRFIAYQSNATNIVPGTPLDSRNDLFVFDRLSAENTLQSIDPSGQPWTDESLGATFGMSEDGRFLVFDLREGTGNRTVYLRDRGDVLPPSITELAATPENPAPGDDVTVEARISDLATGEATIASAEVRVDTGSWAPMNATNGAFDQIIEYVDALVPAVELPTGEREICVRATDSRGWTSRPYCTTVVVGDAGTAQVGLKIRCLHEPLYPEPGDTVTIAAETIDQQGDPIISDAIELYADDPNNPIVTVGVDSATTTFTAPAGEFFYGCAADRATENAFSRFRTVDVGVPELPDFPAIPVLYHGPIEEKIDLLFVPEADAYPDGEVDANFLANMHRIVDEGLFEIPSFVEFQWIFNIWLAREPGFVTSVTGKCLPATLPDSKARFAFADATGVIHATDCRDNWTPGRPYTTRFRPTRLQIVAHELGHAVFSMADEYVTDLTVRFVSPKLPNLFPSDLLCRLNALDRKKNPEECRQLPALIGDGLWVFEPDYRIPGDEENETRDLMQQTGAATCDFDTGLLCDRYEIGDSEEAKFFWKLNRCFGGKC